MADQRLHSPNWISRERYLTASSSPRDLLQHTADILCQSVCTLRVYSHGLATRLILFRHCFAARKLENVLPWKSLDVLQDVMRSEPSPRFNDSPSPNCMCHGSPHLPSLLCVQEFTYVCFQVTSNTIHICRDIQCVCIQSLKNTVYQSLSCSCLPPMEAEAVTSPLRHPRAHGPYVDSWSPSSPPQLHRKHEDTRRSGSSSKPSCNVPHSANAF